MSLKKQKRFLVDNADKLSQEQKEALVELLDKREIKYDVDSAGIYVDLNDVKSSESIDIVYQFTKSCVETNKSQSKLFSKSN